jgi:protease I
MSLKGKKIGILIESDFYEKEIFYYEHRFAEEGLEVHCLSRLWGQPGLTFTGHEYKAPFYCGESFEGMSDEELRSYAAIIVPSAFVSDRLRYSETLGKPAPAVEFIRRAFAEPGILKGIICHGMWLVSPAPELVRGRPVVGHPNLYSDIVNMGAIYVDQDVVVDGDLVTARTGAHCHQFANKIIELLGQADAGTAAEAAFNHVALSCVDPIATERFYTRHFGFQRARVIPLGDTQIVFLRSGQTLLELFKSEGDSPVVEIHGDGPHYPSMRHIAFKVASVDAKLAEMGDEAHVTLGPLDFDAFIPGWRTVWVADPDGTIVEISQGYVDQDNPPAS